MFYLHGEWNLIFIYARTAILETRMNWPKASFLSKSAIPLRKCALRKTQSLAGCSSKGKEGAKGTVAKPTATALRTVVMHAIMLIVKRHYAVLRSFISRR